MQDALGVVGRHLALLNLCPRPAGPQGRGGGRDCTYGLIEPSVTRSATATRTGPPRRLDSPSRSGCCKLGPAPSELAGGADPIEPISNCGIGSTSRSLSLGALVEGVSAAGVALREGRTPRLRLVLPLDPL
jgi:hypothetical protein